MIQQFTLDGQFVASFPSIAEAERRTGVIESSIRKCIKGSRSTAGGYKWRKSNNQEFLGFSEHTIGRTKQSDLSLELIDSMSREDLMMLLDKLVVKKGVKPLPSSRRLPRPYKGNPDNVLVIPDLHEPFTRPGAIEFCREMQERYDCGKVVFIGDILDNHFSSYHETDPDGLSAADELELAKYRIQDWYKVFPEAVVCIGNHDEMASRKAFSAGVSKQWVKDYSDVLGTPGWKWGMEHEIHGVLFVHGTGATGEGSALKRAMNLRQPVCQGHIHTSAGVTYNASNKDLLWGLQVGCLVDDKAYAMSYAKNFIKKSILGCGVITNKGKLPMFIPMSL